ncbi:DUF3047 domain-containing protein [Aliiroseovarius sp. S1339]|uniref:DUF3047 domain-containing protein n=1 Tax=Aliiroseovarius sp. S1339 TaxID=2936990 RepID=UPI0020C16F90|nr:DUF3047 domain-containing protein [Aliiroseovarius sp. S1339]MCK8464348.1 DUF3047 domain-containing protein [Aliiroseovarius sp. S1339]
MPHLMKTILLAATLTAQAAAAGPVGFGDWRQHWFARFADVDFTYSPKALDVQANGAVSITYKLLDQSDWDARAAQWQWSVDQTVPATDLRLKGGDDRNLALYFAFLPKAEAERVKGGRNLRRLLKNPNGRVLVYVWGGDHGRGAVLASPYLGARGKTVVLRPSGTGGHAERVDLAADYRRAFGTDPGALVALALSSDSDDTNTVARGQITDLVLN